MPGKFCSKLRLSSLNKLLFFHNHWPCDCSEPLLLICFLFNCAAALFLSHGCNILWRTRTSSFDKFISHPIHNEATNSLGIYFHFHVLANRFNSAWAQKNGLGNFFGGFIFSEQF